MNTKPRCNGCSDLDVRSFAQRCEESIPGVTAAQVEACVADVQSVWGDSVAARFDADTGQMVVRCDAERLASAIHKHFPEVSPRGLVDFLGAAIPAIVECLPMLASGPIGLIACLIARLLPALFQSFGTQGVEDRLLSCAIEGVIHAARCLFGEADGGTPTNPPSGRRTSPVRRCA